MRAEVFSNLTVRSRISLGFGLVLSMLVILTIVGINQVNSISTSLTAINAVNSVKQRYAINFRGSVHDRAISLRDVTLVNSDEELKLVLADIARLSADYQKSAVQLDQMFSERSDITAEERRILAGIKETEARTLPMIERVSDLRQIGAVDQATEMMLNDARSAFTEWLARINQFIDLQEEMNRVESASARGLAGGFQMLMLITCIAALVVGTVIAALITRSITRALGGEPGEASAIARNIAAGNLAVPIQIASHDRSSVLFAMKEMRDSLVTIVGEVRMATDTISTAAHEIASGNLDLSSRTEHQASSLEETASSMEQLTSTVKQNAANAQHANQLAVSASGVAVRGGEVVSQVVSTMGSINDSARKIVDIIGVIDSIAFQTNILALNAAVEAARAGEQGRGFAVVASEVRNLAQRSAAAAREIKGLIGNSVDKVEAGSKLVEQAGNTMAEIVDSVKRVTDIMAEITAASQEQSSGIEQVNKAIGQMDQVTQQNAALVEEAAAAAESLQDQAGNLTQVISVFMLGDNQISRRPAAVHQARAKSSAPELGRPKSSAARIGTANAPAQKQLATTADEEWAEF